MENKHTPAPWILRTKENSIGFCYTIGAFPTYDPGKTTPACVYVDRDVSLEVSAELYANARLIASAPELLAALKPFAEEALNWTDCVDEEHLVEGFPGYNGKITVGDLRRARIAYLRGGNL